MADRSLGWQAVRAVFELILSVGLLVVATYAAIQGEWAKGSFFLLMLVSTQLEHRS